MATSPNRRWSMVSLMGTHQRAALPSMTTFIQEGKSLSNKLTKSLVDKSNGELVLCIV